MAVEPTDEVHWLARNQATVEKKTCNFHRLKCSHTPLGRMINLGKPEANITLSWCQTWSCLPVSASTACTYLLQAGGWTQSELGEQQIQMARENLSKSIQESSKMVQPRLEVNSIQQPFWTTEEQPNINRQTTILNKVQPIGNKQRDLSKMVPGWLKF